MTIINAGWETLQPPLAQVLLSSLSGLDKDGRTHLDPDKKKQLSGNNILFDDSVNSPDGIRSIVDRNRNSSKVKTHPTVEPFASPVLAWFDE